MFIGPALQVDGLANSSTVHSPSFRLRLNARWNMNTLRGRRRRWRSSRLLLIDAGAGCADGFETFQAGVKPTFVETLDAVEVAKTSMPLAR